MIDTPSILAADRAKFDSKKAAYAKKSAQLAAQFEIGQRVRNRVGSIIGEVIGFEQGRDGTVVSIRMEIANRTHAVGDEVQVYPEVLKEA